MLLVGNVNKKNMLICQNVEINWTKEARGGKMASTRNAVPYVFPISSDRQNFRVENCIWGYSETDKYDDNDSNKFHNIFSGLIFSVEKNQLFIKYLKFKNFEKKVAVLKHNQSFQVAEFSILLTYDFEKIYKKKIMNLYFGTKNIPINYFQTVQFDYKISEKEKIWT